MTGLLLAGGKSRRLGKDKRLIPYRGVPLVLHAYRLLQRATERVLVLIADTRDREVLQGVLEPQTQFLFDPIPGEGPLGALAGALGHIPGDFGLLLSTDLPRITSSLLEGLIALGETEPDGVIPLWKDRLQVTCALYHRRLEPLLAHAFRNGERSISRWLKGHERELNIRWVPEEEWQAWAPSEAFQGVNTLEDLERLGDADSGEAIR